MHTGYVKLWRKSIATGWLQNHKLWVFWCWCLMKASHKEHKLIVGFQEIQLNPGEFIFGLKAASKELRLTVQNLRTCISFLKDNKNITIKTTNKFSIISIVNWDTYQSLENENNTQINKPLTNDQQTTNKPLTTNKNVKNVKNVKNNKYSPELPSWIPENTFQEFQLSRKRKIKPESYDRFFKHLKKLCDSSHASPEEILNQSIVNGWEGIYELKTNNTKKGGIMII